MTEPKLDEKRFWQRLGTFYDAWVRALFLFAKSFNFRRAISTNRCQKLMPLCCRLEIQARTTTAV
jgi:hypothetical protein